MTDTEEGSQPAPTARIEITVNGAGNTTEICGGVHTNGTTGEEDQIQQIPSVSSSVDTGEQNAVRTYIPEANPDIRVAYASEFDFGDAGIYTNEHMDYNYGAD
ncbi:uncharacterized protein N7515_002003 [Penicillium bovifimosum]|uniref:Uncharacterized protein n=1 Tax=Penicillium bovifimosum TaxID=126998 RepID=A0A9W9HAQ5_9EURO|nr:uncharacterized protein N7515_002003 [Penicillium bovifimosum]KAJ5143216.1 hypothetical protein N7515_002003 [Penicillium bovifimosum]